MGGIWRYFGEPNGSLVTLEILKKGGPKKECKKESKKELQDMRVLLGFGVCSPLRVEKLRVEKQRLRSSEHRLGTPYVPEAQWRIYIYICIYSGGGCWAFMPPPLPHPGTRSLVPSGG